MDWNDEILFSGRLGDYIWNGDNGPLAQRLVDVILLCQEILPICSVIDGGPQQVTYKFLQQHRQIILQRGTSGFFTVTQPLDMFKALVDVARKHSSESRHKYMKLYEFISRFPSDWIDFGDFAIHHTSLVNEFWANDRVSYMGSRYPEGYGYAGNIRVHAFSTTQPIVVPCRHQFPLTPQIQDATSDIVYSFNDGN